MAITTLLENATERVAAPPVTFVVLLNA